MDDPQVTLVMDGAIARITLANAARHNALGATGIARFRSLLGRIADDPQVRVLVLTGSGERTFCSGAALDEIERGEVSGEVFDTLTGQLAALPMPSVCALNGSVYGGGAEIALCCDYRIGVENMRLLVPAARIGLCYPLAGLARYVERLGLGAAKRVLVGAEEFDADGLVKIGYLHRVVSAARLRAEADALAQHLAGLAPLAVRAMKQILVSIAGASLEREEAQRMIRRCTDSADLREGLAASRERRAPRFTGE